MNYGSVPCVSASVNSSTAIDPRNDCEISNKMRTEDGLRELIVAD